MNSKALIDVISHWQPLLLNLSACEADAVVGSKWTRKQVLGHLLDSAINNYQRFVRLQHADLEGFPGYDQEHWVAAGAYAQADWGDLVQLWGLFNRQLAAVIAQTPEPSGAHRWVDKGLDLDGLFADYIGHAVHHLQGMRLE
jgi:hypothetical protein